MQRKNKLVAMIGLAAFATTASADGFRLPDQDALATARGEAFVATADNASAIYYNPAGITQLEGVCFRGGIYGIYLPVTYTSPSGRSFDNEKDLQAVPQLFLTFTPEDSRISYGFGIYAPFGLGFRWPQDTGFRTLAIESQLTYLSINPVVAWRASKNLSVGGGITVNYAKADIRSGLVWPDRPNDQFRFTGDGWEVGYTLGVLWRVQQAVSLGLSFRSPTRVNLSGHTEYHNDVALPPVPAFPNQRVGAEADVSFPLNVAFGVSYRPTSRWNVELDADYTDWSTMDTVTIEQETDFPPLLPKDLPATLDWQAAWYYKLGGTRSFESGWSMSAGYIYSENAMPDAHYTPLIADSARHWLSVGTGLKGDRVDFDVAYQYGFGDGVRTVSGSAPSATGQTADGRYRYRSHAVLATLGLHY